MPRPSAMAEALSRILEAEDTGERFVDLAIQIRTVETGEELLKVGGRWDRRLKRYSGPPSEARLLSVHQGQLAAAEWFCEWLRRKSSGDWSGFRRAYSLLLVGGRRGGKTHLAVLSLVIYAVASPGSFVAAISPTQAETLELERALREIMPRAWFRFRAEPHFDFRLRNGSVIRLLSGHKPSSLKRGRVDLALFNEAQLMSQKGYAHLRGAIADAGGLVIVAANPPDTAIGRWVEELHDKGKAQSADVQVFPMDPTENPFVDHAALSSLAAEVDDATYRREILGEFVPIGDVVFYSWSDLESSRDVPAEFVDITAEFTKNHLGRSVRHVIGADFQKTPHMAAVVLKVYRDPSDKDATPLVWIVDEVIVENADEDDLIDGLESPPAGARCPCCTAAGIDAYSPESCAVIADASGAWQDAERTKGRGSFDWFRKRGWGAPHVPDKTMKKNPPVEERCKVGNALLRARNGVRRLYVVKHCEHTIRALRHWEIKNGTPHRRSEYSHIADAVTYPLWRFFPRRRVRSNAGEPAIKIVKPPRTVTDAWGDGRSSRTRGGSRW